MQRTHLALAAALALAGCGSPTPNDLTRLEIPGPPRYAVSTEDGLLALPGDDLAVDVVPITLWYQGSLVLDDARIERREEDLVRLRPVSAQLPFSEFAAEGAKPGEPLFVQVVQDDPEHLPLLVAAELLADGRFGDLLRVTSWTWSAEEIARDFPGAGVYALRKGRYVLVGIVNGLLVANPDDSLLARWFGPSEVLACLSLDAIAPVLPENSDFFARRTRVLRPDFEHGLPR